MQSLELSSLHCMQVLLPSYCAHIYTCTQKCSVLTATAITSQDLQIRNCLGSMFQDHQHPGNLATPLP